MNILIIEDDIFLSHKIKEVFEKKILSNRIKVLNSYDSFLNELDIVNSYDIVLIDIILGTGNVNTGIDIIKIIRGKKINIPLVVISSFSDLNWLEKAFDAGANDYIIKPFRLKELELRILKWFKAFSSSIIFNNNDKLEYNGLVYCLSNNEFYINEKKINLTKGNKYLLSIFLLNKEILLSEKFLIDKIRGDIYDIVDRNLRVNILRLKKSLSLYGIDDWIVNVRGEGYILKK